jgi:hypothetical protein
VALHRAPISHEFAPLVLASDMAADLAYYLGQHPETATAVANMNPVDAARELGRIEARLESQLSRRTIPETKAPAPITPVKGGAAATRDPAKMSADDFAKWRASGGTFSL